VRINSNTLADELARREGKKTTSLNAAQAREAVKILRELLRLHRGSEILEWIERGGLVTKGGR
jgi:hypothetical protein